MKKLIKVKNRLSGKTVATKCLVAESSLQRLVGLLNHERLNEDEGMLLHPCKQIHTFFMRFPIDAIFLDQQNTVLAMGEYLPWRFSKWHFKAKKVLELPLGTCKNKEVQIGDRLEFEPCSN